MQGDTQETGIVLAEWKIFQRNGRKTFQQLRNEKNRLYTELGRGDASRAFEAIHECIGAQIALLSAEIGAETREPSHVSKALVPMASGRQSGIGTDCA